MAARQKGKTCTNGRTDAELVHQVTDQYGVEWPAVGGQPAWIEIELVVPRSNLLPADRQASRQVAGHRYRTHKSKNEKHPYPPCASRLYPTALVRSFTQSHTCVPLRTNIPLRPNILRSMHFFSFPILVLPY